MEMAGLEEVRDSTMLAADWWEEEADLSGTFVSTFLKSGLTGWERPCISCNWVWSWPWLAHDEWNPAEDGGNARSEEETGSPRARVPYTFLGWGGVLPLSDVDKREGGGLGGHQEGWWDYHEGPDGGHGGRFSLSSRPSSRAGIQFQTAAKRQWILAWLFSRISWSDFLAGLTRLAQAEMNHLDLPVNVPGLCAVVEPLLLQGSWS
jgi:hypothetical protein